MPPSPRGADLHVHTLHSDGLYTPETLVATAVERLLRAVAVTDHDTVAGVTPCRQAAEGTGLEVVAGVEFGSPHGFNEIHIVGLFVDVENPALRTAVARILEERKGRTLESVRRLGRLGKHVSASQLFESAAPAAPGRAHVARALVESGGAPSLRAAFQRYLANGMPAHVPRSYPTFQQAIEVIHQAGGVAVYAHPQLTNEDRLIPEMVEAGLDAIEVRHPCHPGNVEERYRALCANHGLLPSGGTDCHGHGQGLMGVARISDEELEALRAAALRRAAKET
ncbi:MAG TPA: PHP domain-containing protein [Candidatus Brocadiia bacterium]|nr:PHP domain-containing protein [Candidatus Brocadiia bacterium]